MDDDFLHLSLLTPKQEIMSQSVAMVVLPAQDGDIGILKRHMSLISALRIGVIYIFQNGIVHDSYFIKGGIARIGEENCVVMVDYAINVSQLDMGEIKAEEKALNDGKHYDPLSPQGRAYEKRWRIIQAKIQAVSSPAYT